MGKHRWFWNFMRKKMPIIGILLKVKDTISFVKISFDR